MRRENDQFYAVNAGASTTNGNAPVGTAPPPAAPPPPAGLGMGAIGGTAHSLNATAAVANSGQHHSHHHHHNHHLPHQHPQSGAVF